MNKHDRNKEDVRDTVQALEDQINSERGLDNPVEDGTEMCPEQTEPKHSANTNKKVMGVVCFTPRVKVRKESNPTSEVMCLIPRDCEVEVSMKESSKTFYCVTLASGLQGFCMKQFIQLKD